MHGMRSQEIGSHVTRWNANGNNLQLKPVQEAVEQAQNRRENFGYVTARAVTCDYEEGLMATKFKQVMLSAEERAAFLEKNDKPEKADDSVKAYIWFSVKDAASGVAFLFLDELEKAAEMARNAGLEDLAKRILAD